VLQFIFQTTKKTSYKELFIESSVAMHQSGFSLLKPPSLCTHQPSLSGAPYFTPHLGVVTRPFEILKTLPIQANPMAYDVFQLSNICTTHFLRQIQYRHSLLIHKRYLVHINIILAFHEPICWITPCTEDPLWVIYLAPCLMPPFLRSIPPILISSHVLIVIEALKTFSFVRESNYGASNYGTLRAKRQHAYVTHWGGRRGSTEC
jgi:hypothetical protein